MDTPTFHNMVKDFTKQNSFKKPTLARKNALDFAAKFTNPIFTPSKKVVSSSTHAFNKPPSSFNGINHVSHNTATQENITTQTPVQENITTQTHIKQTKPVKRHGDLTDEQAKRIKSAFIQKMEDITKEHSNTVKSITLNRGNTINYLLQIKSGNITEQHEYIFNN